MKRVLVAPLDWGLGHATRCIPIIKVLLESGYEVILAGSGASLALLKTEFPELKTEELPGYKPTYPASGSMMIKLALQAPKFLRAVLKENSATEKLVEKHQINFVISDNRYGCYSRDVPSVFITHQLKLIAPAGWRWLAALANYVTHIFIKRFSACWVPDFPGSILSGKLSRTENQQLKFIGPLSRLNKFPQTNTFDLLAIISGPEPQRTLFEQLVIREIIKSGKKALVVQGVIGTARKMIADGVEVVDHLNSEKLSEAMAASKMILSRSGYSTIMDLARLGKKAIFVPTPGQTEQEYLAQRFKEMQVAYFMDQKSFSLTDALRESENYTGFQNYFSDDDRLMQALASYLPS
ncbi:MAG: glycosyltransferase [Cyclobacteriaceae bacterium]|nr:MAG: glycosyltransferase [Cyclobacteriaceae bacterium]